MGLEKTIAIIGAGNVAMSLAPALKKAGIKITQIFSKTFEHAENLAKIVGAKPIRSLQELNADFYLISVPDDYIEKVAAKIPKGTSVVLHTSGSTSADILKPHCENYGVLYPLQTFSKSKIIDDFNTVPVFIEGSSEIVLNEIKELAEKISGKVSALDSENRMGLHISAVFACNFSNSLLSVAHDICNKYGIDFLYLKPLVEETVNKAFVSGNPATVQTGPAIRNDVITMEKHLNLLKQYPELEKIYAIMSEYIAERNNN